MKRLSAILILLAALASVRPARAGDSPFAVDVWNTDDRLGLPENTVIALAQTRDGYLWLGTQNGLARFDGGAFTPFNVNNTPDLPGNVVSFLFEDASGGLWLGTAGGALAVIQNGAVKKVCDGSAAAGRITAAFDDQNGAVWFVTDARRIFRWKNNTLDLAPPVERGQRDFLTYLAFHLIVPEKSGASWQLQNGVERWRGDTREKNFGAPPWGAAIVTAAIEDDAGNLVVGTRGAGVFWFDAAGGSAHITRADGLSQDFVLSLAFDSEKNLWVGTDGGGLDRVRKKIFTAPSALAAGVAQSVAEDAAGGVWTAFNLRGLAYWLTNSVRPFESPANAWCVLAAAGGRVWAGTSGQGLFRLENNDFVPVPQAFPAGQKIFCLAQTRGGKILAGGDSGLAAFDGRRWEYFSANTGLGRSAVRAVAEEADGTVWIGTESDGLFTLRDGKLAAAVSAPVKDVSVLLAGADGALWAGSFAHGLARRSAAGEWKTFSHAANGLANDDIGSLAEDAAGNLWIGSYEGLVRVEKKSVADVLSGSAKTLACRTFLTRECSAGAQPAALRARDGRLFFPTISGVAVVNPADLKPNLAPPPVAIESVLVDGAEQNTNALVAAWRGEIVLQPENEQLEIRFASLNFSAPKNSAAGARFKYRLEGRDKNWTDIGGERVAHFPKLPPGKFIFHVAACNEDGVWNNDGATLAVTVLPPFWRTPGFIIAAVLVLLGAIAGIVYLVSTAKLKRQLRAHRQKELLEQERGRIARDLHDQIGANLTQVALLGEMAEADKEMPAEVEQHAQQIYATARETTRALDEIVWQLNSSNDTLASLANYACKYAQDYFALAGVSFRAELPAVPPVPLPPEVRHNVFLAFKEAVNNVVKHAQAGEARVKLEFAPDKFVFSVADNGRGLGDLTGKQLRNGLKNMTRRLSDVGGEFSIAPGEKGGTVVKLIVPLKPE